MKNYDADVFSGGPGANYSKSIMSRCLSRIGLNVHIYPTAFENESRILKVTKSLVIHNFVSSILIIAMAKKGLPSNQCIDTWRNVWRIGACINGVRFWAKTLRFIEWSLRVVAKLSRETVDMVNCHSLSVLPLCVLLKFLHGCILVYEPHELETETSSSKGLRKRLAKITEKIFIGFADLIFVVSESISNEYARMYKIKPPPVVLNCPNHIPPLRSNILRERLGIAPEEVIFLYQGSLAAERGVSAILEAFKLIKNSNKVVVFMGYGPLEEEIKESTSRYKNIHLHPAVPPESVLQYTASGDVGIHFIQNTCLNHYYCMPNKLFEYAMAGLPVIISNMYDMAGFLKIFDIGVVARDESPGALVEAIEELNMKDLPRLKENALEAAKQFCWEEQEKVLISTYREFLYYD